MAWKPFNNSMDSYLARSTKNRDYAYSYNTKPSIGQQIRKFFSSVGSVLIKPFRSLFSFRRTPSFSSSAYDRVDLSHISSEETFVIGGRPPSKAKRFWKRLKAAFKDDKPRAPAFNARNQFSIKGTRPSSYETLKDRRREMADTIDMSAIAKTMEKGRIK